MEINLLDIVINIINIVVLYILLRVLLYKPVSKFMRQRTERVENELRQAEALRAEAADEKADYAVRLAHADEEAQKRLLAGNRQANEQAAAILAAAKEHADELLSEAREKAQEERRAAVAALKGQITDMSLGLASQILQREVTEQDNHKVIDTFFEQVG